MLPSYYNYIFVHLRQKGRFLARIKPKIFVNFRPEPDPKSPSDLQLCVGQSCRSGWLPMRAKSLKQRCPALRNFKIRSALIASLNLGKERSFQFGCKLFQIWAPLNCNAFLAAFEFIACK